MATPNLLATLIVGLAVASEAWAADRPDFESIPCPQRRQQVIAYWGGLPPSANACEAARRKLAGAQDLIATKQACGETRDWSTRESPETLRTHEQDVRLLCATASSAGTGVLRKTNAGNAGAKAGCPTSIRIGGQSVSVLEPIQANGSAEIALGKARGQLRTITDQGSCDSFANAQECENQLRSWRDMVSALECHARAERDAPAQATTTPTLPPAKPATANPSPQAPGKPGKADDFLAFADPSGTTKAPTGASRPTASKGGAKSFLPFAEKGSGGEESGAFPTPHCRFISDSAEQHDATRQVCVDEVVWECQNRTSPDPKKAWWRLSLTKNGCGSVRTIEAVERDRKQLKRATKGMLIHD